MGTGNAGSDGDISVCVYHGYMRIGVGNNIMGNGVMKTILAVIFIAPVGIIMGLFVKEVFRWFKKWLEIRNINWVMASIEKSRKEAGLSYDHELLALVKWSKRKWWLR